MTKSPSPTTNAILDVHAVSHVYPTATGSYTAIEDISFTVDQAELVSIVGPSGSGKTTLLRILAGLLQPTGGTVSLLGERVTDVPDGMAMVFQDYSRSLLPWLTVEKNVQFPLNRVPTQGGERARLVRDSLAAVGLDAHREKYPWQLSGGMQQRVAIARAIAYRPRLMLMDEPFASVDAQTRADLEDLVLDIHKQFGMTILFVTHDIDESVYLANRVLVLSRPPATLVEDISVQLPDERDQITTKETKTFVETRARVARLIRGANQ